MSLLRGFYRICVDWTTPERWIVGRFVRHCGGACAESLPDGVVIDIGGGSRPFDRALRSAFPGRLPIATDMLASAEPDFAADAHRLPLADGAAAVVCMFQVLQHLARPTEALAEARRVLAHGGLLIVTYPALCPEGTTADWWRWTSGGMFRTLRDAGFSPVGERAYGGMTFAATNLAALAAPRYLLRHRRGWRAGNGFADLAGVALAFAIALPFHLLGFAALAIDWLVPTRAFAVGACVIARRDDGP